MKFNISWLKEHLNTAATFEAIIEKLENLGFPSENSLKAHESLSKIIIAKIIEKEAHPNADKLNIYTIDIGSEKHKIVCGDKTLNIGDYVPYAQPGIKIPSSDFMLKIAKIRGIESHGMLCSAAELNFPEGQGVMRCYTEDFGKNIAECYENEGIIEIEVTPNRPDMLSIRGIARELSYHGLGELKNMPDYEIKCEEKEFFEIKSNECLGMICALLEHIPSKTSPKIAKRLFLTDQKVINIDIIDSINYITHELGQPMHAFDYPKIDGKLLIENIESSSSFSALDGKEVVLEPKTLVIKDSSGVISWPGIIGGEKTKTTQEAKKILIETGIFKIDSIQRRKNNITTNAAKLFERGVDPKQVEASLNQLFKLLGKQPIAIQKNLPKFEEKIIKFDLKVIEKILGISYTQKQLKEKLEPRGFCVEEKGDLSFIKIPSWRGDIETQNCIVEELVVGEYDKIISKNLDGKFGKEIYKDCNLSVIASCFGFWEGIHPSISKKENDAFEISSKFRKIKNPLSSRYAFLRGSLIPQLLDTLSWHYKNSYFYAKFFEIGPIYGVYNGQPWQENIFTAIYKSEKKEIEKSEVLLELFYSFWAKMDLDEIAVKADKIKWGDSGASFFQKEIKIGQVGKIKKEILNDFDLDDDIFALEIYPERIIKKNKIYPELYLQMPIYRDLSFKLPLNFEVGKLVEFLKSLEYLFEIFDIFPSKALNIERNIGLRFTFLENHTLLNSDIEKKVSTIRLQIEKKFAIITL